MIDQLIQVLQRIRAQPCSTLVLTQCDARSFPALRLVANTAAADAVSADASHMCLDNSAVDNGDVGKPSQPDTSYKIRFDRILADVPCRWRQRCSNSQFVGHC